MLRNIMAVHLLVRDLAKCTEFYRDTLGLKVRESWSTPDSIAFEMDNPYFWVLEDLLSDDFRFTSPRDDHLSKAQYFERCFPHGDQFRSHRIEQICEDGDEAFVRYLAELRDGTKFRNTEYFRIEAGKIKEIAVYFGATVSEG